MVSSRRQSNVDKAVAQLQSEKIQVTGTTCNVGKSEDRERLVNMVKKEPIHFAPILEGAHRVDTS